MGRRIVQYGGALLGAIFLTACVSASLPSQTRAGAVIADDGQTSFTRGLPAQSLAPNACGLFLWSKSDISNFVFFAEAGREEALAHINGAPTDLKITRRGGTVFGQFFTEYDFTEPGGGAVTLSYEPGDELTDGARVQAGSLQYTTPEGWRMVLPVLGARVCRPILEGPSSVTSRNSGG